MINGSCVALLFFINSFFFPLFFVGELEKSQLTAKEDNEKIRSLEGTMWLKSFFFFKFLSLPSLDNQNIVFLSSITEQVVEHHLQDIDNLSIPSDIGGDEGDHFDASQPVASKWYLFFHFPIPFYNVVTEDFVNFIQMEISAISKHKNCIS